MKENPIIFNGEMVRAILEGRKTQTRRPIIFSERVGEIDCLCIPRGRSFGRSSENVFGALFKAPKEQWIAQDKPFHIFVKCPYGHPGDLLWVRETFNDEDSLVLYKADLPQQYEHEGEVIVLKPGDLDWKPSIHMPREYSRINLEITNVRVESVRDISEEDAIAEGCLFIAKPSPSSNWGQGFGKACFRSYWDSIYCMKEFGWDKNPWVWVVEFRRIDNA